MTLKEFFLKLSKKLSEGFNNTDPAILSGILFFILYLGYQVVLTLNRGQNATDLILPSYFILILLVASYLVSPLLLRNSKMGLFSFIFFNIPKIRGLHFLYSLGSNLLFFNPLRNLSEAKKNLLTNFKQSKLLLILSIFMLLHLIFITIKSGFSVHIIKLGIQGTISYFYILFLFYLLKDTFRINSSFIFKFICTLALLALGLPFFLRNENWISNSYYGLWYFDRLKLFFFSPNHFSSFLAISYIYYFYEKKRIDTSFICYSILFIQLMIASGSRGNITLSLLVIIVTTLTYRPIGWKKTLIIPGIFILQLSTSISPYTPSQINLYQICPTAERDDFTTSIMFTGRSFSLCKGSVFYINGQKFRSDGSLFSTIPGVKVSNKSKTDYIESTQPAHSRIEIIKSTFIDLKNSFYLGLGAGADHQTTTIRDSRHSFFLTLLVEFGVPGLILWLLWIIVETLKSKRSFISVVIISAQIWGTASFYELHKFVIFWLLFVQIFNDDKEHFVV